MLPGRAGASAPGNGHMFCKCSGSAAKNAADPARSGVLFPVRRRFLRGRFDMTGLCTTLFSPPVRLSRLAAKFGSPRAVDVCGALKDLFWHFLPPVLHVARTGQMRIMKYRNRANVHRAITGEQMNLKTPGAGAGISKNQASRLDCISFETKQKGSLVLCSSVSFVRQPVPAYR